MSRRRDGDDRTVVVRGEIDLATAGTLEQEIAAVVAAADGATVVVDLTDVTFLDSVGINALLTGRRLAEEHDRGYRVTGAVGLVREVLDLTGVWTHLSGPADDR